MNYYLGLATWEHKEWPGTFFSKEAQSSDYLSQYAMVFNTVEGSTGFHGIPTVDKVNRWREQVPEHFRFCFTFPRLITHDLKLQRCREACTEFLNRMKPLHNCLGPLHIQLPESFSPMDLPVLKKFLVELPMAYGYAVEVSHPGFFLGSDAADELQGLLQHLHIDWVNVDSTGLFASQAKDTSTLDAQQNMPQLPVEKTATASNPIVRFIGQMDLRASEMFLHAWVSTVADWLREGKSPYVYIHTPNNAQAHRLAERFHCLLREQLPSLPELERWPGERIQASGQMGLF